MRAINKQTGRPIVAYQETCYFTVGDSFDWVDDAELQMPDVEGEFCKSDEIIYTDDQGNECLRWDLDLVA